jgi:hypothetical protein
VGQQHWTGVLFVTQQLRKGLVETRSQFTDNCGLAFVGLSRHRVLGKSSHHFLSLANRYLQPLLEIDSSQGLLGILALLGVVDVFEGGRQDVVAAGFVLGRLPNPEHLVKG